VASCFGPLVLGVLVAPMTFEARVDQVLPARTFVDQEDLPAEAMKSLSNFCADVMRRQFKSEVQQCSIDGMAE
jgi:hypothetical protein